MPPPPSSRPREELVSRWERAAARARVTPCEAEREKGDAVFEMAATPFVFDDATGDGGTASLDGDEALGAFDAEARTTATATGRSHPAPLAEREDKRRVRLLVARGGTRQPRAAQAVRHREVETLSRRFALVG